MYQRIFNLPFTDLKYYPIEGYIHNLQWSHGLNIGFLKSDGYEYNQEYWNIYQTYKEDPLAIPLSEGRANFVMKNLGSFKNLCDVGVGAGQFVEMINCKGTDINPIAINWLKEKGCYAESVENFSTLTLWDVIEHIEDPRSLLQSADNVFISTPIYENLYGCLSSKHLKPGEHIWYFTHFGIGFYMSELGFELCDYSDFETELGRDSIRSYFFKRSE